jgi:beta-galactosidase
MKTPRKTVATRSLPSLRIVVSYIILFVICWAAAPESAAARTVINLEKGWLFTKGDPANAQDPSFDDKAWNNVTVPHDWAIYGPFDKTIDRQIVAIEQNNERIATEKTGRTGALPYIGTGWYRHHFNLPEKAAGQAVTLLFDGAMSRPTVYVNGQKAGEWGYGYNAFHLDITPYVKAGSTNVLAVRLENWAESSRWYPGAGLYRPVQLIITNPLHIATWGTWITTPEVTTDYAKVRLQTTLAQPGTDGYPTELVLETTLRDEKGTILETATTNQRIGQTYELVLELPEPQLWSPETPHLYTATTTLKVATNVVDETITRFGVRTFSYTPAKGFQLNGQTRKFKGVCLHHDLGPLGAAVNEAAMRRQLTILKDMGCDAIRTAHNMPAAMLLDLCDEMGFLVVDEAFDEWKRPKCKNGYNTLFDQWAEKDLVNFVRRDRNHPSIVMWSIGNEVPEQSSKTGSRTAYFLREIIRREDPSRPVSAGMDRVDNAIQNQFAATLDVPGLNYRLPKYQMAYDLLPQGFILGSETASTISSRGIYKFPVKPGKDVRYPDLQCSAYDVEACNWSNLPDDDWMWQDDKDWVIGEFVWTGFDYLGEPTPYDDFWPSRSSYFGICDLAGLPKDRYYLYRSRWNTQENTLHILPHWNWKGREGEVTPVFVYTNHPSAELFVNGQSQGRRSKGKEGMERYRLMWNEVVYQPGELTVVAYDDKGQPVGTRTVKTAGPPTRLVLETDRRTIKADGKDIAFVTVSVVDKEGNPCADVAHQLAFEVTGAGAYRAACNGDATSVEQFHLPTMKLFSGKLVVLVQSAERAGDITLTVKGQGLKTAKLKLSAQ